MMMQNQTLIYMQIANKICDDIIDKKYETEKRIPSAREFASEQEVNPNTVIKAFEWLNNQNIIYNKRGLGYFVSTDATMIITQTRKKQFLEQDLPYIYKKMEQLSVSFDELQEYYNEYKQKNR